MTTANSIITPQTPVSFTAVATTAETAFNNPTNVVTLVDEASDNSGGMRLTSVFAITRAAVGTACNCQLYKKVGSTYTLTDSAILPSVTPSASVANGKIDFGYTEDNPLVLKAGTGLAIAIGQSVANGVVFRAQGGAY